MGTYGVTMSLVYILILRTILCYTFKLFIETTNVDNSLNTFEDNEVAVVVINKDDYVVQYANT